MRIIDMTFACWLRTSISKAHNSYEDLLQVVYRYYPISEQKVDLMVATHRGHSGTPTRPDAFHPNNLLNGYEMPFYYSQWGSPSQDWIKFTQSEQKRFAPTKIMIRNVEPSGSGIKSIALFSEYGKTIQIDDIKEGSEEQQWFELDSKQSRFLKAIRMDIWENHGDEDHNAFHEFGITGVLESD